MDRKRLDRAIAYLEANPHAEWTPREPYPAEADTGYGLLKPDFNYLKHHAEIEDKGIRIEDMSLKEIATMLTYFARGERFCDGFTAEIINSGELLRVLKRLRELTEHPRLFGKRKKEESGQ